MAGMATAISALHKEPGQVVNVQWLSLWIANGPACESLAAQRVLETSGSLQPQARFLRLPQQPNVPLLRTITSLPGKTTTSSQDVSKDIAARKKEIEESNVLAYPQYARSEESISVSSFTETFEYLEPGKSQEIDGSTGERTLVVEGRVQSIRTSGLKLVFLDIAQGAHEKLQVVLNAKLLPSDEVALKKARQLLRRGDVISVKGVAHRTTSGQLSLMATHLPQLLAPCLHHFPVEKHGSRTVEKEDGQALDRHVELLTNRDAVATIVLRSEILHRMREFFRSESFVEVETPILAGSAGGASARPFQTSAAEFTNRKLSLRIAPELWLKRLVIGGMEKIFEIGPCFRNEGLDRIHNPEFTTCEFYSTYTSISQLRDITERLFRSIDTHVSFLGETCTDAGYNAATVARHFPEREDDPFPTIDFIPTLNSLLQQNLPNLASATARSDLLHIFHQHSLPLPSKPTVPRLLDKLSALYLEPQCSDFTFIVNHPECMSPLSKSFVHPTAPNAQPVAARAELFVQGREIVNCYEEENSPFEQRRKFNMQQHYARGGAGGVAGEEGAVVDVDVDDEAMGVDEDYLRALEWGLPPTGGWGCGIDRLVMLFAGKDRIGDVLSFGNLRAVTRSADRREKGDSSP